MEASQRQQQKANFHGSQGLTVAGELDTGVDEILLVWCLHLLVALLAVPRRVRPAVVVDEQEDLPRRAGRMSVTQPLRQPLQQPAQQRS